ncbi:hypothetical protein RsS62_18720 [Rhizobium dioscoreae]|uniref:Uncharacterized protein n=1 Tax=Rhizobium dioscoreae TaxID=2653122 RepID=A0ABQ0Z4J7_9HYPH|nr:hypothetical protein RsS62_18720 [Rhizobium dioscoreae]GES50429.1 hypothetical protein RsS93_30430 [Rhizobium dioscoreae]GLU81810.1 hypothetical protein Rhsp01_29860 [Rhizobium sp. NBRC 114257]
MRPAFVAWAGPALLPVRPSPLDKGRTKPSILDRDQGARTMSDKKQQKLDEKKHKEQDDYLEEALEETFPASDPISPGHVSKKPEDKK